MCGLPGLITQEQKITIANGQERTAVPDMYDQGTGFRFGPEFEEIHSASTECVVPGLVPSRSLVSEGDVPPALAEIQRFLRRGFFIAKSPADLRENERVLWTFPLDVVNPAEVMPGDDGPRTPDYLATVESPCEYEIRPFDVGLERAPRAFPGAGGYVDQREQENREPAPDTCAHSYPCFAPRDIANARTIPTAAPIATPVAILWVA